MSFVPAKCVSTCWRGGRVNNSYKALYAASVRSIMFGCSLWDISHCGLKLSVCSLSDESVAREIPRWPTVSISGGWAELHVFWNAVGLLWDVTCNRSSFLTQKNKKAEILHKSGGRVTACCCHVAQLRANYLLCLEGSVTPSHQSSVQYNMLIGSSINSNKVLNSECIHTCTTSHDRCCLKSINFPVNGCQCSYHSG